MPAAERLADQGRVLEAERAHELAEVAHERIGRVGHLGLLGRREADDLQRHDAVPPGEGLEHRTPLIGRRAREAVDEDDRIALPGIPVADPVAEDVDVARVGQLPVGCGHVRSMASTNQFDRWQAQARCDSTIGSTTGEPSGRKKGVSR